MLHGKVSECYRERFSDLINFFFVTYLIEVAEEADEGGRAVLCAPVQVMD